MSVLAAERKLHPSKNVTHRRAYALTLPLLLLAAPLVAADAGGALRVRVTHVDAERGGTLRCGLFRPDDEWLGTSPSRTASAEGHGDTARCEFDAVSPGRVALTVLHDEDDDREMDRTLGVPSEGYAFSRGVQHDGLTPPDFDEAAIELDGSERTLEVRMSY